MTAQRDENRRTVFGLLTAALTVILVLALASAARGEDGSWNSYWTVGGTSACVEPGSAEDLRLAANQERLYGRTEPFPCPNPATVATTTTVPCRVFVLAGGNYCYPEGTAEYNAAVESERRYQEWIDANRQAFPPPAVPVQADPRPETTAPPTTTEAPPQVSVLLGDESTVADLPAEPVAAASPPTRPAAALPETK